MGSFGVVIMNIENLKLTDIVKETELGSLEALFSSATGMAVAALDKDENLGGSTRWHGETSLCAGCVRKSAEGAERCKKFTQKLIEDAKRSGRVVVEVCHAGAAEFAAPVVVRGVCVGYLVGGQVLVNRPDIRKIASISRDLKIDTAELTAAVDSSETTTEERVRAGAELFTQIVADKAEAGYLRAESAEKGAMARESMSSESGSEITQKINTTMTLVSGVERACEHIKNAVAGSTKAVDNTDAIVKTIENSSTQLTLIGFNASIEAKRAGAAGAGFNVIAQEVRTLADRNTKQTGEIEKTLNGIKRSMGDINNQIRSLYGDIEKISDSMNELSYATFEADKASTED